MFMFSKMLFKNVSSSLSGGGPSKKNLKLLDILLLLLLIFLIYFIKTYIVYVSYNSVVPKIQNKEKLSMFNSLMLIILVIGLLL